MKNILVTTSLAGLLAVAPIAAGQNTPDSREKSEQKSTSALSHTVRFKAPAGTLPATRHVQIDGFDAAVLPNGRLVTPAGVEANVGAPKPFGLALSPDGKTLATINSGAGPFSITLITGLTTKAPKTQLIVVNATFLGVTFSSDSSKFFASGGENGNIWVGSVATAKIVGSVNLNGAIHSLNGPLDPTNDPPGRFKGAVPGNLVLSKDGRYLFVVDQAGFRVHMVETSKITTGVDKSGFITEPNNFPAVVGSVPSGRYTFGIGLSLDGKTLFAANPGVFQYKSLRPDSPTGDPNIDFPLGYPGAGYPEETENDRIINIKKVDPRNHPDTLSI